MNYVKVIKVIVLVIVGIVIFLYLMLCVFFSFWLSLEEYVRFGKVFVKASVLHGSGIKSLQLGRQVFEHNYLEQSITINGTVYVYPLPRYSTLIDTSGAMNRHITFSRDSELYDYFHTILPQAGWEFQDQLGAGYFFEKGDVKLGIVKQYYLTTGISELSFVIEKQPKIVE